MLIQLEIKNFAIIDHSIVNLANGFNVLSGETGAGKSIVFDAISSILRTAVLLLIVKWLTKMD